MCIVTNGFFCIEYEVINGRKCIPGDMKDVVVNFINHTGSLKYIIDLKCSSHDPFISLSLNGTGSSNPVHIKILLPPAYRKRGSVHFQKCQITSGFKAVISSSAGSVFKTVLDCRAFITARANNSDPDAIRFIQSYPKSFDFYPPLET
jgi:hypothetical protein